MMLSVLVAASAPAATRIVRLDGSGDFTAIQPALDASAAGDTVLVADGTYVGTDNRNLDFAGKDLVLRSESDDPATCIIDVQASAGDEARGFVFGGLETDAALVRGFTVTGAYTTAAGGGFLFESADDGATPSVRVEHCIVTGNTAARGAGVAVIGEVAPRLSHCQFVANDGGGGLWTGTTSWDAAGAGLVEYCAFDDNTGNGAVTEGQGFYSGDGYLRFRHCTFSGNTVRGLGHDNSYGSVKVDTCEVRDNGTWGVTLPAEGEPASLAQRRTPEWWTTLTGCDITGNGDGGVFARGEFEALLGCNVSDNGGPGYFGGLGTFEAEIIGCQFVNNDHYGVRVAGYRIEFHDNVVSGNGQYGVGVDWGDGLALDIHDNVIQDNTGSGLVVNVRIDYASNITLQDNIITGNGGNGVTLEGDPFLEPCHLISNTIAHNTLHGVECTTPVELQLTGTIIAFNEQQALAGSYAATSDLNCVDLYGNLMGDYLGDLLLKLGTQGNIAADPMFCGDGDYTIHALSPCLDGNHPDGAACGLIGALDMGCPPPHSGPHWNVSADGDDLFGNGTTGWPFATIQQAIDAAAPGDTITVGPGTYSGDGNRDIDFGSKDLVVRSESGDPATCIIDCGGSDGDEHRGFIFQGQESRLALVRGFTVINAWTAGDGGGILCQSAGIDSLPAPRIERCVVSGSTAGRGAGIAVVGPSIPSVVDCVFSDNTGDGGAWLDDETFFTGGSLVEDCRFENNSGHGLKIDCQDTAGDLRLRRSAFNGNGSHGLLSNNGFAYVLVDTCEARDNAGVGFATTASFAPVAEARDFDELGTQLTACIATGNAQGGILSYGEYDVIRDCIVTDNLDTGIKRNGPVSTCEIERSTIQGNQGHGIEAVGEHLVCTDNIVVGNSLAGIRITNDLAGSSLVGNVIALNGQSGVVLCPTFLVDPLVVTGNTIVDNGGHGIEWTDPADVDISATIIAFNGQAALSGYTTTPVIACTDLFGNVGGNWIGDLADLLGGQGNISADPEFCDAVNGVFTLLDTSPCADGNHPDGEECGDIGARGAECVAAAVITAVRDVPNDQGRQVRLSWDSSHFDQPGSPLPILEYGIYRFQADARTPDQNLSMSSGNDTRLIPGWDFLATVPARGDSAYQYVAATLCDSTAAGICWSSFFVSAMTDDPYTFFDSATALGYSVDNILPPPPPSFTVNYGPKNSLAWSPANAPDVAWYNIYRDSAEPFEPGPGNLVAQVAGTSWIDSQGTWGDYYLISAVDDARNESTFTSPSHVVAVEATIPVATELLGNAPNPFNPSTTIAFTLASQQSVSLRVYDLTGRLVRTLVGEVLPSGRHEVDWRGRDDQGRSVASGLYLYRLQAGEVIETRRMALIK